MSLILDYLFPPNYLPPNSILTTNSVVPVPGFEGVLPLFSYTGPIRELIRDLKFNYVTDIVPLISDLITREINLNYPNLLDYWRTKNFTIIPIPLHQYRQNYRGFNQSQLIVATLGKMLSLPTNSDLLIRTKSSAPQSSKTRTQRQTNISHAYQLTTTPPPNIIIFDDVYTTGYTLKSAASVFPVGTQIWGLTLAG